MKSVWMGTKLAAISIMCLSLNWNSAYGQGNVGTIIGHVSDQSGGAVLDATVTLLNPLTNEKRTVQSDERGDYTFNGVRPATYTLSAEFKGFKTALRENVILQVAEKISVHFILEPGEITQTIDVRSESPLLQPGSSDLGSVIAEPTIVELPLSGRNVYELVLLVPGTVPSYSYGSQRISDGSVRLSGGPGIPLNQISINGGRNLTNEFLLDDVPNTTMGYNGVAVIPPLDAVQEFNVLTNSFSAKYGRTGGGLTTVVTKSGTNNFHGTGWEFLRNDNLDANDFFANRSGAKLREFKQNQFGVAAGGPIIRNKTFIFGSYEGFRQISGGQMFLTVPTALQKNGDFSKTFRSDGSLYKIYDPFTTHTDASGNLVRDQFMGCDGKSPNVICPDRFDPVAKSLLQYFPDPNLPGDPLTNTNNFISQAGSRQITDAFQVRLDHNLSGRQRIFGRYSFDRQHFDPENALGNIADFNSTPFRNRHNGLTLSYTNTLNPTTVLNVRYGLVRERQVNDSVSRGFDITQIGFPKSLADQFEIPIFPRFDIAGYTSLGTQFFSIVDRANTTQSLAASLSKVIGKHSIEGGMDLRLIQGALFQAGWPSGQFFFDPGFTNGPDPYAGTDDGNGLASLMVGTPSGALSAFDPHWFFTQKYYSFYIQDDIKVSPKLTLNVGLRYDYESPLEDRYNALSFVDFKSDIPIEVTPVDVGLGLGLRPQPPFRGGAAFPGVGGIGKGVSEPDRNDLGPRFGLAYAINDKTVIRSAYGIIYPGTTADNSGNYPTIQGFNPLTSLVGPPDGATPFNFPDRRFLLSNPYPNGLIPVQGSSKGLLTSLGDRNQGMARIDPHAYFQQWNFGVQRELPGNLLVEAAYVGAHSVHLSDFGGMNYNALPDQYLSLGNSLYEPLPNPFFGVIPSNSSLGGSDQISRMQLLKPYPYFTDVVEGPAHQGSSSYNGFQLKVQKRMSKGLSLLLSYTAAKLIDSNSATDGSGLGTANGHQDYNNLRLDRSISALDRSQVLRLNYIYELPFGRGKAFGNGANPALNHLISGWQVSSIMSFATGFPLAISCGICTFPASRPDLGGDPNQGASGPAQSRLDRYFNVDAFAANQTFHYGTVPRVLPNTRGPGQANTDISIIKNTVFKEPYRLQFRAEFFNAFNRPEFGFPDMSFGSATFGRISSQVNIPRQIQFGIKFYW
jgi:Carboxypeptidase regulatory-like domain/TonB dependent receptor-like, beta-barrel